MYHRDYSRHDYIKYENFVLTRKLAAKNALKYPYSQINRLWLLFIVKPGFGALVTFQLNIGALNFRQLRK